MSKTKKQWWSDERPHPIYLALKKRLDAHHYKRMRLAQGSHLQALDRYTSSENAGLGIVATLPAMAFEWEGKILYTFNPDGSIIAGDMSQENSYTFTNNKYHFRCRQFTKIVNSDPDVAKMGLHLTTTWSFSLIIQEKTGEHPTYHYPRFNDRAKISCRDGYYYGNIARPSGPYGKKYKDNHKQIKAIKDRRKTFTVVKDWQTKTFIKFLKSDGTAPYHSNFKWDMPVENADGTITPGEWHIKDNEELGICNGNVIHLCDNHNLDNWIGTCSSGAVVVEMECGAPVYKNRNESNKFVTQKARVKRVICRWDNRHYHTMVNSFNMKPDVYFRRLTNGYAFPTLHKYERTRTVTYTETQTVFATSPRAAIKSSNQWRSGHDSHKTTKPSAFKLVKTED